MGVAEKIARGEYSKPFYGPPIRPDLFNRIVADLSMEELISLPDLKEKYHAEYASWRETRDDNVYFDELKADLQMEFFGRAGHPKADKVWDMARANFKTEGGTTERLYLLYAEYMALAGLTN